MGRYGKKAEESRKKWPSCETSGANLLKQFYHKQIKYLNEQQQNKNTSPADNVAYCMYLYAEKQSTKECNVYRINGSQSHSDTEAVCLICGLSIQISTKQRDR